jgi:hypothetical protein
VTPVTEQMDMDHLLTPPAVRLSRMGMNMKKSPALNSKYKGLKMN